MNVLVMGGTRFFGIHLVESLLKQGHQVTIATRGNTKDSFGTAVERIAVDRSNPIAMAEAFHGKFYDAVCDNIAYSSLDVKNLMEQITCGRYILTSSISVYPDLTLNLKEEDFDPLSYQLRWCTREDDTYDEIKRQAECALFQNYSGISAAAVRFPYVIGTDDYTNRLFFYVEHILKGVPIYIDNGNSETGFIRSSEAGSFLAWLVTEKLQGPVNAASSGTISLNKVIDYIEYKTGKKAILAIDGEPGPYNSEGTAFSINTEKAESNGFCFSHLETWLYDLIDFYIDQVDKLKPNHQSRT